MCTGVELMAAAAIAGTATSAYSAIEASNARKDAKAQRDKLAAEAKAAQAEAAQGATAQIAMRKKAMAAQSLYGQDAVSGGSGRTTLGV